jgi:hypothetical protein
MEEWLAEEGCFTPSAVRAFCLVSRASASAGRACWSDIRFTKNDFVVPKNDHCYAVVTFEHDCLDVLRKVLSGKKEHQQFTVKARSTVELVGGDIVSSCRMKKPYVLLRFEKSDEIKGTVHYSSSASEESSVCNTDKRDHEGSSPSFLYGAAPAGEFAVSSTLLSSSGGCPRSSESAFFEGGGGVWMSPELRKS